VKRGLIDLLPEPTTVAPGHAEGVVLLDEQLERANLDAVSGW